jgi:DNA invertase Pin-like site-specific DNA recombinase
MNKIGIWCRVSGEEQRENTSLDSQRELGIDFCKRNNYEYEIFSEVISGTKLIDKESRTTERVLRSLEDKLFSGEIIGLWLYDYDRLVRDVEIMVYFKKLVEETKCKVFVLNEEKDIGGDDFLDFGIRSIIGDFERRKILKRMKDGRNRRWKEGKGLGKIGYGFDNAKGKVWINEQEGKVIKDIYKFFMYKSVKKYGDCQKLLTQKYGFTHNGKRLDGGLVKRVLGNEKYNGKLVYKTKTDGDFVFHLDKIVDDEIFGLVKEKLKFVKGIRSVNTKEIYVLKGLVYCKDCERKMWIEGSGKVVNGKSYRYYKCSSYKENEKRRRRGLEEDTKFYCLSGNRGNKISKDKIDEIVWSGLFKLLSNSDSVIKEYKKRFRDNLGTKDRFISKSKYYKKELIRLEGLKSKMVTMVLKDKWSDVEYDNWCKTEYDDKKLEFNAKLNSLKTESLKYGYVDKIESWMDLMKEDLLRDYNIKRKEDRRRIVERYVSKVFIKELHGEEGQKVFQINLIIKIGGKTGSVGFEYNKNKKSLDLKLIEKDFYILNDDLVAGTGLEPVTFGL